ncbi:MAG: hypothetical protein IKA50_04825 [Clostridia bacterium]|nr:hypothetical protein [Clostridia bacterium]
MNDILTCGQDDIGALRRRYLPAADDIRPVAGPGPQGTFNFLRFSEINHPHFGVDCTLGHFVGRPAVLAEKSGHFLTKWWIFA